jgi:hypothetical protein
MVVRGQHQDLAGRLPGKAKADKPVPDLVLAVLWERNPI